MDLRLLITFFIKLHADNMPSSLQLALRGSRTVRNIGYAVPQYRYAAMAYKYGPTAARAAGRIARFAYKRMRARRRGGYRNAKRQKFSPKHIGNNLNSANAKRRQQALTVTSLYPSRTLVIRDLTTISQGSDLSQRERQIVNIRGFKICLMVKNNNNRAIYLNCAVVSPKNDTVVNTDNFFRSDSQDSRGTNFSTALSAMQFHCLNLNTDKFNILKHKRYRLCPVNITGGFIDHSGRNYINIDWYIKLKRQIRYDSAAEGPIEGACKFVYWVDMIDANAGDNAVNNVISTQERIITYFREPKN